MTESKSKSLPDEPFWQHWLAFLPRYRPFM